MDIPSQNSAFQDAVPPVPDLPPMPAQMRYIPADSFTSIEQVLERQAAAPTDGSPSRPTHHPAPSLSVTSSTVDTNAPMLAPLDGPWTPTREKRWAGAYQPLTPTMRRPALRNRSASTTAYPTHAISNVPDSRQVPTTPMRPRTQGSHVSRPTGDYGHPPFSSRPTGLRRPTTSHHRVSSSAHNLLMVTAPPSPNDQVVARPMTAKASGDTVSSPAPLKSVFDLDSEDEDGGSTAGSKIRRFVLRPFTGKPSNSSTSPHKRSQSDGKKSLSNGKRMEAAKQQHRRARGATEGAAGPFLATAGASREALVVAEESAPATAVIPEVGEEKDAGRPRLKRKESFAQFLGFGSKH